MGGKQTEEEHRRVTGQKTAHSPENPEKYQIKEDRNDRTVTAVKIKIVLSALGKWEQEYFKSQRQSSK